MKEYVRTLLASSGTLTTEEIVTHILVAALLSVAIYLSYWITHAGTAYSKKFNVSLMTLTVLTATVMTVIGNNVALSLGMVGALSIVRFRTAIKDSRDTAYIFWTIIVGICCGIGDYKVAGFGTFAVFIILLVMGRVRNENRILLIIRASADKTLDIEGLVYQHFNAHALLKVKNTTPDAVELIYEMSRKTYELTYKHKTDITRSLYALGGVEYANIVTQSDEIAG